MLSKHGTPITIILGRQWRPADSSAQETVLCMTQCCSRRKWHLGDCDAPGSGVQETMVLTRQCCLGDSGIQGWWLGRDGAQADCGAQKILLLQETVVWYSGETVVQETAVLSRQCCLEDTGAQETLMSRRQLCYR